MEQADLRLALGRKEMELKALLEITQAINANVPEDDLFNIFKFTAISNLRLRKFAVFVFDKGWIGKVVHGVSRQLLVRPPGESLTRLDRITHLAHVPDAGIFSEFDLAIPVLHREQNLALVFVESVEIPDDGQGPQEPMEFLQALCNIMIVAIQNKKLQRQELEQEVFRKELEIARDVQHLLFPKNLPQSGKVRLEASYLPHDRVGGDYYDYIPLGDDRFLVCIADVSGKGVGAALMMSNFQASLHTLLRHTDDLEEIVHTLNEQVNDTAQGEKFITFFAALYHINDRCLHYINAGHNPPVLCTPEGKRLLQDGTTVLGAVRKFPMLKPGRIHQLDDFLLFCYTDGVTETMNESDREFGLQPVMDCLGDKLPEDLRRMHQDIIISLDNFKGRNPYRDDITMLSCRVSNKLVG